MAPEQLGIVDRFHAVGRPRRYAPGETILHSGDASDTVHLVVSGTVRVVCWTRDGNEVLIDQTGPGGLVGEIGVLDAAPRSASIVASGSVETVEMTASDFNRELEERPEEALALLRGIGRSLRNATRTRVALRSGDVAARLATRLMQLHRERPPGSGDRLQVRHDDLAAWAAVNRETVTRALGRLRAEGLVRTGRGWIEIADPAGLERRAAD